MTCALIPSKITALALRLCNACKIIFKGGSETFVHRGLYREHVRLFETLALSVKWSWTLCIVIYNEDLRQTGEDEVPSEVSVEYDVHYYYDLNNFVSSALEYWFTFFKMART